MATQVAVVDDSLLARIKLIQALPATWQPVIHQAGNGEEALALCRDGKAEVMFLDLTMPVLDGYQVLERLRDEGLACKVFVVSADIQPLAIQRTLAMGALAFLQKPLDTEQLVKLLEVHQIA